MGPGSTGPSSRAGWGHGRPAVRRALREVTVVGRPSSRSRSPDGGRPPSGHGSRSRSGRTVVGPQPKVMSAAGSRLMFASWRVALVIGEEVRRRGGEVVRPRQERCHLGARHQAIRAEVRPAAADGDAGLGNAVDRLLVVVALVIGEEVGPMSRGRSSALVRNVAIWPRVTSPSGQKQRRRAADGDPLVPRPDDVLHELRVADVRERHHPGVGGGGGPCSTVSAIASCILGRSGLEVRPARHR